MHLWNSSRSSCFGTTTNVVAMTKWPMTSRCWNDSSLLTSMLQQTVDTASDFLLWNCLYYFKPYLFFPQSLCATGNVFGKFWQQSYVGPVILVTKANDCTVGARWERQHSIARPFLCCLSLHIVVSSRPQGNQTPSPGDRPLLYVTLTDTALTLTWHLSHCISLGFQANVSCPSPPA